MNIKRGQLFTYFANSCPLYIKFNWSELYYRTIENPLIYATCNTKEHNTSSADGKCCLCVGIAAECR